MKRVLFVCVHNAGRSQMAMALLNHRAKELGLPVEGESAGTQPGAALNQAAVAAMEEIGISIKQQSPKLLTPELAGSSTRIISMGCGVEASACPAGVYITEDWELDDPAGQPIEKVREIRNEIANRVDALLRELS